MIILVKKGKYLSQELLDQEFILKPVKTGKFNPFELNGITFAEVLDPDAQKEGKKRYKVIEVYDYEIKSDMVSIKPSKAIPELSLEIRDKFNTMESLYDAVFHGAIKSLIVSGPAGVGKSHSVETKLKKMSSICGYTYSIIKGHATPLFVFEHLSENCKENHIVVFDDTDQLFYDHSTLNVLKAALDSKPKRIITWGTTRGGFEKSCEFKGGVIFLTNISFNKVTKNEVLKSHLQALSSRSHYFDVSLNSNLEKFIRIKQVCEDEDILKGRQFKDPENPTSIKKLNDEDVEKILEFVEKNMEKFSELSLRLITKIADIYVYDPFNWKKLIGITCFKNEFNQFS